MIGLHAAVVGHNSSLCNLKENFLALRIPVLHASDLGSVKICVEEIICETREILMLYDVVQKGWGCFLNRKF